VLFAIPLIPGAIAVAILRYRLLDIRLVVSRLFAWLLVSAGVVGAYVALVAFLDEFVSRQVGRSAVATVLIALVAAPVLPRVQRLVERAFYGQRRDPGRLVSAIGAELRDGPDGFDSVMAALTRALRLSGAELRTSTGSVLARSGTSDGAPHEIPLTVSGDVVGALVVGGRSGERHLTETDRQALELVAVPLALAVQSRQLADAVEESRKRVVAGRAEERRRLRRDLHDGVGPSLTGIAMNADAAANLLGSDPQTAEPLIRRVAADTRESIAEIRRIIEGLRPSVLDGSDLVEAIRLRAESLSSASSGLVIDVHGPPHSRPLDAAVEDAAYRIATEALNNIVKHSSATRADVNVSVGDQEIDIVVQDDGRSAERWEPGVGLGAMAERAAELGGRFMGGPTSMGGRVHAVIPLASP
jgi:two-component system NarL family sensor kinase